MAPSLLQRYSYGANSFPVNYIEAAYSRLPGEINQMGREISSKLTANLKAIEASQGQYTRALNEANYQLEGITRELDKLASATQRGTADICDALDRIEGSICAELGEIRWVMAQLDDKLAEMLHIMRFPRQTEASELILDGMRALSARYLEDAESCLEEAIEKKRTSFHAHLCIGHVYIHKNDEAQAIDHFQKAVAYAPEGESKQKALALESLARLHFAVGNFPAAANCLSDALQIGLNEDEDNRNQAIYHAVVYMALAGRIEESLTKLTKLCRQHPRFFAIAAVDEDLKPVRGEVLKALDDLAASIEVEARRELKQVETDVGTGDVDQELLDDLRAVRQFLADSQQLLGKLNFSDSHKVLMASPQVRSDFRDLRGLVEQKKQIDQDKSKLDDLMNEMQRLVKEIDFLDEDLKRSQQGYREASQSESKVKDSGQTWGCTAGCLSALLGILALGPLMVGLGQGYGLLVSFSLPPAVVVLLPLFLRMMAKSNTEDYSRRVNDLAAKIGKLRSQLADRGRTRDMQEKARDENQQGIQMTRDKLHSHCVYTVARLVDENTEFTVVIKEVRGDKKIKVMKELRAMRPDLSLQEARDLVDSAPKELLVKIRKDDAPKYKKQLEDAGAVVDLVSRRRLL